MWCRRKLQVVMVILVLMTSGGIAPSPGSAEVRPSAALPLSIPDLNLRVDLTRAISSSFRLTQLNCTSGTTRFPTVVSMARSMRYFPERWNRARTFSCQPRARLDPYTFTLYGAASSNDTQLTDGDVVTRCSFGGDVKFEMNLVVGTTVADLVHMEITDSFRFPVTCGFRISSKSQTFAVVGSLAGVAVVDGGVGSCGVGFRACASFSVNRADVTVTNGVGKYGGAVALGTFDHADIFQIPELVQLSYLVDTVRTSDVVATDIAPVALDDVPPVVSSMQLQFLAGTSISSLLRPMSPVSGQSPSIQLGGDITVSTAPGTACRAFVTRGTSKVSLPARTATSLGLVTWLVSASLNEKLRLDFRSFGKPATVTLTTVCTTIDSRSVMTRKVTLN